MKIYFLRPAQSEVDDAYKWYEAQSKGLGKRFLDDLNDTIKRISAFPLAFTEIESGIRRCLLTRFPYGVYYGVDAQMIIIIAVAHLHRKPKYWIDRITQKDD